MSAPGGSTKVILFAFCANLGIALAKLAGALISGSTSLMAESIHSAVDCANQVLLFIGGKKAMRAPDSRHPLGYGREQFFWSFLVAIALFLLGGVYSIYEGAHKLLGESSHELEHPWLGIGILAFGFLLEALSFRACLMEVRRQSRYSSLWTWFHRSTASDLLVVFAEDLAALLGLFLAALFLLLSWFTGNAAWDSAGSVVVGVLLLLVASFLAVEVKSLLIGEAAEADYREPFERLLAEQLPGARLLRLIALQTGANAVMVSCKLHPGDTANVAQLVNGINAAEREMKKAFPEIQWLFCEPDFED